MEEQTQQVQPELKNKAEMSKIIIVNIVVSLIISAVVSFAVSSLVVSQRLAGFSEMQKKLDALSGKIKIN